jgi:hypothetical protein
MFSDLGYEIPEEKEEEAEFFDQFVISVDNVLLKAWNGWIIFLEIFGSMLYLYFTCFRDDLEGQDVSQ